ncbi:MAG: PLP-dependent aminotransferase family protein [Planctomycetota bacterium]
MARASSTLDLGFVSLDPCAPATLSQQLYGALRSAILTGPLTRGDRLPSTRELSSDLGISRTTVINAFEQLRAEGYIESSVGRGTHVRDTLPEDAELAVCPTKKPPAPRRRATSRRNRRCLISAASPVFDAIAPVRLFRAGVPAVEEFPIPIWSRLMRSRWRSSSAADLAYGAVEGYRPLRHAIVDYLRVFRGVRCSVEQVLVVHGTQQAIDLVSRLLIRPNDRVLVENPGYRRAHLAFDAAGAELVPVPVDALGMRVDLRSQWPSARLAYVTPSHQFPMGVTLPLERRLHLLDWAARAGAFVMEDDYDSEYRYVQRPLAALQGLDTQERVIYVGSFSKTVFPACGVAYVVVPPAMIEPATRTLALCGRPPSTIEQMVLRDFLSEGHFARHLRRMRKIYAERRTAFVESAQRHLSEWLEIVGSDAGLHCTARLAEGLEQAETCAALVGAGIQVVSLADYTIPCAKEHTPPHGLVFGFACGNVAKIRRAVGDTRDVLERLY